MYLGVCVCLFWSRKLSRDVFLLFEDKQQQQQRHCRPRGYTAVLLVVVVVLLLACLGVSTTPLLCLNDRRVNGMKRHFHFLSLFFFLLFSLAKRIVVQLISVFVFNARCKKSGYCCIPSPAFQTIRGAWQNTVLLRTDVGSARSHRSQTTPNSIPGERIRISCASQTHFPSMYAATAAAEYHFSVGLAPLRSFSL